MFILSEQVFEVLSISSHTDVHATWSIASPMTRWCRPEQIIQQPGAAAAEVRIFTENLYTFHVFGGNKLIREFSDKGCNVRS